MRTIRHNFRITLIALLALAIQLWAAFGHVHHHLEETAGADAASTAACASASADNCLSDHDQDHDGGDERSCQICWSLAQTAAGALPSAQHAAAPAPSVPVKHVYAAFFGFRHATAKGFDARGPPHG